MLTPEENELMCRIGPGTPMGRFMREYWIPALMTADLQEPDGPPLRIRLLGENLLAWRQTDGSVGLIQNACPHRGASLFFGRNEENGLRCVYHGWKFDTTGACIDMPNEPAESNFKHKIKATAYPCSERNGMVWAYMGPRATPPPLPDLLPNIVSDCEVWTWLEECNYMQGLEGDIDTVHAQFLHGGHVQPEWSTPGSINYYVNRQREARLEAREHEIGTSYAAVRPAESGMEYWRMGHFMLPFFTINAPGLLGIKNICTAWVPVDDENTMVWNIGPQLPLPSDTKGIGGLVLGRQRQDPKSPFAPYPNRAIGNFTRRSAFAPDEGWYRKRPLANKRNDYMIDRNLQRNTRDENWTYTGIPGPGQDPAAQESMGTIYDRTQERLGTTDAMIIRTRRKLIQACRRYLEGGVPTGVDNPELYRMRGGGASVPVGVNGLTALADVHFARTSHPDVEPKFALNINA